MSANRSVIIVGGGVFGSSTAIELITRGYKVTLVEPTALEGPNPYASSTDVSKLVRSDYGNDELYTELNTEAIKRWKQKNEQWRENLYHECGLVNLSIEKAAANSFMKQSFDTLSRRGYPIEKLDSGSIANRFPVLKGFSDGYYNKKGGWAESGEVVARFLKEAKELGVNLVQDQMKNLLYDNNLKSSSKKQRVIGVELSSGKKLFAHYTIVATGAWTPTLLPWLRDFFLPSLQPVFHFKPDPTVSQYFKEENGFSGFCADITSTGFYGFPYHEKEGIIKLGRHSTGYNMNGIKLTPEIIERKRLEVIHQEEKKFRTFLSKHIPALKDAPAVKFRLCLYEDTFDGHFLIDHDPEREGLVVAAGGSGHGFKFGSVIGEVIADILEKKPNQFAPRFAWRTEGDSRNQQYDICRFVDSKSTVQIPSKL